MSGKGNPWGWSHCEHGTVCPYPHLIKRRRFRATSDYDGEVKFFSTRKAAHDWLEVKSWDSTREGDA